MYANNKHFLNKKNSEKPFIQEGTLFLVMKAYDNTSA